ncbi:MAG: hypothetical protein DHS20C17_12370 [Cyclobacteriaceae bacterium]|nr:MAG: hypothetical protein DHS20C17_12370 [Cyclobacteriaceae bacterium]
MEETTNQNVSTSTRASLGDRFLGILIDELVIIAASYLLSNIVGWSLSYLIAAAYLLVRDALPFLDGQSIGKKVMKTRSVREDSGEPLTNDYKTSILRNILLFIPIAGLIDALFIFSGDGKRLGDKLAKTVVIYEK